MECIDWTKLKHHIHILHERDPEEYTLNDCRVLGLIYALMAVRSRHVNDSSEPPFEGDTEIVSIKG